MGSRCIWILLAASALASCSAGKREAEGKAGPGKFALHSPEFDDGDALPVQFTCDGDNLSPPLRWVNPPAGTKSFVLTMSDPDGPAGTYRHWGAYNIAGNRVRVNAGDGLPNAGNFDQVLNSKEERQYLGPCPPAGNGPHRYVFKLIALSKPTLEIGSDVGVSGLESEAAGSKLGEATLTGTYERK